MSTSDFALRRYFLGSSGAFAALCKCQFVRVRGRPCWDPCDRGDSYRSDWEDRTRDSLESSCEHRGSVRVLVLDFT